MKPSRLRVDFGSGEGAIGKQRQELAITRRIKGMLVIRAVDESTGPDPWQRSSSPRTCAVAFFVE